MTWEPWTDQGVENWIRALWHNFAGLWTDERAVQETDMVFAWFQDGVYEPIAER